MSKNHICKKLNKSVRKIDQFGKKVSFNFDRDGDTHKTTVGGIISIFCVFGMLYYTMTCIQFMIYR